MENKRIVIITTGWFPEGDAGAVRLSIMGRSLVEAGFDVTVLCRGKLNDIGNSFGVDYKSLRNIPGGTISKAIDYEFFPFKVKKYLNAHLDSIYAVYLYNAHLRLFKYCKQFCKKHQIKLFHDCVEWYSPEEFKNGEKSSAYKVKNEINTNIIDKQFSVIAITSYLRDYYSAKGIRTIRIPILCDATCMRTPKPVQNDGQLVIFYGGLPGTKDLVGNLFEAALLLDDDERKKVRLIIVGATRDYLVNVSHIPIDYIDRCGDMLELSGRVPREEVLKKMEEADFSFLARDSSLRYAQAGFPSKVVEALSNSTPMLCNITSDLGDYLFDGRNAIIARSHKPEDLKEAIQRALRLSATEKNKMSQEALNTAEKYFDYRKYINSIKAFFLA